MKFLNRIYAGMIFLFLYLPLAVMVAYSFNSSKYSMNWKGFTFDWYFKLAGNDRLIETAVNSLLLASVSATVATLLGTVAAVLITKYRFHGRKVMQGSLYVVMMAPDIVMGISLLILFVAVSIPLGFWTLLLAHVTFSVPFVVITVSARLKGLDPHLLEVAKDLGAGDYETFRHIIVPLAWPSVLSGWLLSFTLSMDDVIVSFFTTGPTFEILPLRIYSMVRLGVKPEVNALCAVMIAVTLVLVTLSQLLIKEKK
ncbi:spermidine/putrescine ABC transporter permease PotC [Maridesulfovibrio sp.]|uniref:spermidine/putrescine ABC transporter permease PotC n=1 Tax=Maridesulfovibrio sp. TaxID=2795000 RepID=UPI0029C9EFC1|nr:spermidine/putrescine ABC transporter permease PotC [Maridesulfovibrio sp.]